MSKFINDKEMYQYLYAVSKTDKDLDLLEIAKRFKELSEFYENNNNKIKY
jgi:hypothetical protein